MHLTDFEHVGIVCALDPSTWSPDISPVPEVIDQVEAAMSATVRMAQFAGERGRGTLLNVAGDQLDVLFYADRIEVRSLTPHFDSDVATRMLAFFEVGLRVGPTDRQTIAWRTIGYNYISTISRDWLVAQQLKTRILADDLEARMDGEVLGLACGLWLQIDSDTTLWLRLEPHRESRTSTRLHINANFSRTIGDEGLPDSNELVTHLVSLRESLENVLDQIDL